jgi:starch synthase
MKIVQAASELLPYMKTGGLADAVSALSGALADRGHEVYVFLPGYRAALEHRDAARAERRFRLKIEMGDRVFSGDIRVFSPRKNLSVYLVCHEEFFDRRFPYGNGERDYEDNDERFIFFCKGVAETLRLADLQADIVHSHDWQAALLPLFVRETERSYGLTLAIKTVFTIHNIAFQGVFPARAFAYTNLPDELNSMDGLEFYRQINLLKGGVLFADRVTTVSPQYAKEIQTPEFGFGLDGVVQTRADDLVGLLNGVDGGVWNPGTDVFLPARYTAENLAGKATCRAELLKVCGFDPAFAGPVYGMICRMTEQKGVDMVLGNQDFFLNEDCRLILLGTGDRRIEEAARALAARSPRQVFFGARLDEAMSHLIEAGSDFFLMPSLFEPCGLNQMYSQLYGTIPIVSRVGGLIDTVVDADSDPADGTGIMTQPVGSGLREALQRSLRLFGDKPRLAAVQRHGMNRQFGWDATASAYETLYQDSL